MRMLGDRVECVWSVCVWYRRLGVEWLLVCFVRAMCAVWVVCIVIISRVAQKDAGPSG